MSLFASLARANAYRGGVLALGRKTHWSDGRLGNLELIRPALRWHSLSVVSGNAGPYCPLPL
jgi:hypothetical protein